MPRLHRRFAVLLAVAPLFTACRPAEQIHTYNVPKEQSRAAEDRATPGPHAGGAPMLGAAPSVADGSRMIAAMLRGDRQAWFFKVVGAPDQIAAVSEQVQAFLESVGFDEQAARPTWRLPADWSAKGQSGMRLDTFVIPTGSEPVEMSVIGLGLSDDWGALVRSNVDRWRGQIGLAPLSDEEFESLPTREIDGREFVTVDLAPENAVVAEAPPANQPPANQPPMQQPPAAAEAASGPLAYDLPKGWVEAPPTSMRLANLTVGEGEAQAAITVFAFSAMAPAMADPLANVNRWRAEIGMPDTTQEQLDKEVESVSVGGLQCKYVELTPPAGAESTLAAMGTRGQQVWFFKLRGPAETVAAERESFRKWLDSVRFTGQ